MNQPLNFLQLMEVARSSRPTSIDGNIEVVCEHCGMKFVNPDSGILMDHLNEAHDDQHQSLEQFRVIKKNLKTEENGTDESFGESSVCSANDSLSSNSGQLKTTKTSNFYKISGSTTSSSGDTLTFLARIDKKWNLVGHFTELHIIDATRVSRGASPTATYKEKKGIVKRYYKCKNCKFYMMSWQNKIEGALYEYGQHDEGCTIAELLKPSKKDPDVALPEIYAKDIPNCVNSSVKAVPLDAYQLSCLYQIAFELGLTFAIEICEIGAFSMKKDLKLLKFSFNGEQIELTISDADDVCQHDIWPETTWGYYLAAIRKKCVIVFGLQ